MKIGVSGIHLYKKHFGEERYLKLKELGYDGADFSLSVTEEEYYTLPLREAERLILEEKRLSEEAGIEIHQVHGPWRYPPKDATEEDRLERMDKMKKSIYFTSLLGCENWVIHPIMPFGLNDVEEGNTQKTRELNIRFFSELLNFAKENNVTICYENMPFKGFSISTPEDVLKIVNEINDENFRICLDTGHVNIFGTSPADAVRLLGDKIRAYHIHDNKMGKDLHLIPYFGTTDWDAFAEAVKEVTPDAVFSLETTLSGNMTADILEEIGRFQLKIAKSVIKSTEN